MNRWLIVGTLVLISGAGLLLLLRDPGAGTDGAAGEGARNLGLEGQLGDSAGGRTPAPPSRIASTPFEDETEAEVATPGPRMRVLVSRADGSPARAVLVAYFDEKVAGEAATDAGGRCVLPDRCRGAEVVAFGPGFAPWCSRLAPDLHEQTLTLPAGQEISGTILIEGEGPASRLGLQLSCQRPWPVASHLPQAVWDILSQREGDWKFSLAADTDPEGRFRVTGLERDWKGRILRPPGFEWVDASQSELPEPRIGLILRLRRTPALTGRVVDAEEGGAVTGARVDGHYRSEGGLGSTGGVTDEGGRFSLPLPSAVEFEDLVLRVADGQGMRSREIRVVTSLWGGGDVGDVVLAPRRTLSLIVRDPDGRPIAGAVAALGEEAGPYSSPTNHDGLTAITVVDSAQVVRVGAPGWEIVTVPVPPDLDEPLVIVLPPAASLRIRVVAASKGPLPRVIVTLSADGPLFNGSEGGPADLYVIGGTSDVRGGQWGGGETRCRYVTDGAGQVYLSGILPGQQFEIAVRDSLGVFNEARQRTMSQGESGEEIFEIAGRVHAVTGIVRDRAEAPLPQAHVYLSADGKRCRHAFSEAGGQFRFDRVLGGNLRILVQRPGYVPFTLDGVMPRDAEPLEITLTEGREILLEVVDTAGAPVMPQEARAIVAAVAGWQVGFDLFEPREEGPGLLRIAGLPTGVIELQATVAGRAYTLQHDTSKPRARLEVPVHGALRVSWASALPGDPPLRIRLETATEGASSLEWTIPFEARDIGNAVLIPLVLPGQYQMVIETIDEEDAASFPAVAGPLVSVRGGHTTECTVTLP